MTSPSPAPSPQRRTVVALVHNVFTHDSRVLNETLSLAALGDRVVVVAVVGRGLPERETTDGVEVIRFGSDPVDTRIWRNRSRITRPWRFRREVSAAIRRRLAGRPGDKVSGVAGILGTIILLPWVALTLVYHYGGRGLDGLARSVGRRLPSAVVGGWIEDRARSVVFAGHRPLRLRDWGNRVEAAVVDGLVPRAAVWHANDLETLPLALGLRARFGG
nr:hypothetical protein [Chloroflexota bacterium]